MPQRQPAKPLQRLAKKPKKLAMPPKKQRNKVLQHY
jgi:hypothetical protein